jgi:toxin ParE1/3/4
MNRRVLKKPQAQRDLINHFAYIARDKLKPAIKFLKVAEKAVETLAAMPTSGREWSSANPLLAGIRVYIMPSPYRNYLIFYRFSEDALEILTVLHGARDLQTVLISTLEADRPSHPVQQE